MLVELSVMEQRYHAVMEIVSGAPVTEVARRYGVSRQAVHGWLGRYESDGLAGLADHSHRPRSQPRQLDAGIEALVCQWRGSHPRWGPRRLLYELGKARVSPSSPHDQASPAPSRRYAGPGGPQRRSSSRCALRALHVDSRGAAPAFTGTYRGKRREFRRCPADFGTR